MRRSPSFLLFLACLAATLALIWAFPQPIVADQNFIKNALSPSGAYPAFETGVFSNVLVRALGAVLPLTLEHLNEVMRSLAAVFYSATTYLLFTRFLREERTRFLGVALFFTSRLPLLWLSSELLAGGLLTLAVLLHSRGAVIRAALALGCFAFCKPDLVLPAGAVLALWLFWARGHRIALGAAFLLVAAALNLPGLLSHGFAHFQGNRSWMAFSQHYSALFSPHQFSPALADEPFGNWERNVGAVFPGVSTFPALVLHYPSRYLDFLALGQVHLLKRLALLANFLLIPAALLLVSYRQALRERFRLALTALAAGVGLLPITLITFVHVRYLAKYYPLALTVGAAGLEEAPLTPRARRIVRWSVIFALLTQVILLALSVAGARHGENLWLPD